MSISSVIILLPILFGVIMRNRLPDTMAKQKDVRRIRTRRKEEAIRRQEILSPV